MKKILAFVLLLSCLVVYAPAQMSIPGWSPCTSSVTQTNSNPPTATAFLTSGAGTSLRNDFPSDVGYSFSMKQNCTIVSIGRFIVSGNTQSHTIYLVLKSSCVVLSQTTLTSLSVIGATPGQYLYGSITPTSINAGTNYILFSSESSGGDQWYDLFTPSTTSDGVVVQDAYTGADPPNANCDTTGTASEAFVPVNFKYTIP